MAAPAGPSMPKFFLFGDSHAGTLMSVARSLTLDFAGFL
jgi:hypothetical protein